MDIEKLDFIVADIREEHRKRCFAMQQRMRLIAAVASFVRYGIGWRRDLPKKESDDLKYLALALVASKAPDEVAAHFEKRPDEDKTRLMELYAASSNRFAQMVKASALAAEPFIQEEKAAEKAMIRLAKSLPVYDRFCSNINGFGALGLAIIVGEAGNLSGYPNKSKLFKRMGVALVDGIRQGGLSKTATSEEWIKHGYVRDRRARLYTIGDSLIKKQNPYREFYLKRKEYEREIAEAQGLIVAPAADIPAKERKKYKSLGHIHKSAQRIMEKRLLRDLWQAWRETKSRDMPINEAAA